MQGFGAGQLLILPNWSQPGLPTIQLLQGINIWQATMLSVELLSSKLSPTS